MKLAQAAHKLVVAEDMYYDGSTGVGAIGVYFQENEDDSDL